MRLLIVDSNKGAQTLINLIKINLIKTVKNLELRFAKLNVNNLTKLTKNVIRELTLQLLINNLKNNYDACIIMCLSASSSIFDILIKNNFVIANVLIIEPIIPLCLYIKKHKFKTLLVLSTSITQKSNLLTKLLNTNTVIKHVSLNLLENDIQNSVKVYEALEKLANLKTFIAKCDGLVIGCSSYSLIKNIIMQECKTKYNFKGALLDSSVITLKYLNTLKII